MPENKKKLRLTDIIDIKLLQQLQDMFAKATNVASLIVDEDGPITEPSNFSEFCAKFTRGSTLGFKKCLDCDIKWGKVAAEKGEPVIYTCHSGLTDFAVPIFIKGEHIASMLGGQVLTAAPSEEYFRKIARELGINEDDYVASVKKISIVPKEAIKAVADILFLFGNSISEIGHKGYESSKRSEREALYMTITEAIRSSLDIDETKQRIVEVICRALKADRCFIIEYDKANDKFFEIKEEYLSADDIIGCKGGDISNDVPNFLAELKKGKLLIINKEADVLETSNYDFGVETPLLDKYKVFSAMAFPLFYGTELLGALAIHYVNNKHHISDDEIGLINMVSNQIEIAIYQAKLFKMAKEQAQREGLLRQLTEKIRRSLDVEETLSFVCEETAKVFGVQRVTVVEFFDKKDFSYWKTRREYKEREDVKGLKDIPYDRRVGAYNGRVIMQEGKNLVIDSIDDSDTPDYYKKNYKQMGVKSILSVPIKSGEDKFGIIFLSSVDDYRHWTTDEVQLLENISSQIFVAIKQAELYNNQKKTAQRESLLVIITEKIRSSLDLAETLSFICEESAKLFNVQRSAIATFPNPRNFEEYIVKKEYKVSPEIKGVTMVENFSKSAAYVGTNLISVDNVLAFDNIQESKAPDYFKKTYASIGVKSMLGAAIRKGDDVWGTLVLSEYNNYRHWSDEEKNLIKTIASQIYIAINQAELFKKQYKQAQRESLLRNIFEVMRSSLDINVIKRTMVNEVGKALNADICLIVNFNSVGDYLYIDEYSEYRSSPLEKSFVGYDTSAQNVKIFNAGFKSNKEINYSHVEEFIVQNNLQGSPEEATLREYNIKSSYGVPINYANSLLGTIILHYTKDYQVLDAEDLDFIRTIAIQAGIAIHQAELFKITQEQARRERLLREIIATIRGSIEVNLVKREMVSQTGALLGADRVAFADYDADKEDYYVKEGNEYRSSDKVKTFVGFGFSSAPGFVEAVRDLHLVGKDIVFSDLDNYLEENNLKGSGVENFYREMGFISSMAINISYGEFFYGNLVVTFEKKRDIEKAEIKFIKTLADQAGIALYQSNLYEKEKQTAQRERLLREISTAISSTLDYNLIRNTLVDKLGEALGADLGVLYVQDLETKRYVTIDEHSVYLSSDEIKNPVGVNILEEYGWGEFSRREEESFFVYSDVEDLKKDHKLYGTKMEEFLDLYNIKSTIFVSIRHSDMLLGMLAMNFINDYKTITTDDVDLVKTIANQAGIALYQANLYKITQDQAQRETLLRKLIETVRSSMDLKEVQKNIINEMGKAFNADRCYFRFIDRASDKFIPIAQEYLSSSEMKSLIGVEPDQDALNCFTEELLKIKRGFYPIVFNEELAKGTPIESYLKSFDIKADYALPIIDREDELVWLVLHYSGEDPKFGEDVLKVLETVAYQIDIAFNQIKLYNTEKQTAHREKLLREITSAISSTLDFNETRKILVTKLGEAFDSDLNVLYIQDPDTKLFIPVDEYSVHRSSNDIENPVGVNIIEEYGWGEILRSDRLSDFYYCSVEDFMKNNNLYGTKQEEFFNHYKVKSAIFTSIRNAGVLLGMLAINFTKDYKAITEDDVNLVKTVASQAGIALHQAKLYKMTQVQAEREKIAKNMIEILRSTLDRNIIKHLFVKNIGEYFKADRVLFSEFDQKMNVFLPIDKNSEYLSSAEVRSFVGYDWACDDAREYMQPLLERRELKIYSWDEYIQVNPKSPEFVALFESAGVKSSYNLPVLYEDKMMGYFCIEFTREVRKLSNEDINRIRNICTQTGIALYHADLYLKAQESNRSKAEFISNISNEFRVPLNFIIEFSSLLSKTEFERSKEIEYLDTINKNGRQLLELTDDIIDISEIESEKFILHYEHIDTEQLIREVVNSIKLSADVKGLNIDISLTKANINADRKMLIKIIHILLVNAIKFTQKMGSIIIKSELEDNKLLVSIEDTGISRASDTQDVIFEEFKQVDTTYTRRQQGAGLGLSIAKKLVELHNGTIHVESAIDKGSRFWFILPKAYKAD